jgi:hypothetical protein
MEFWINGCNFEPNVNPRTMRYHYYLKQQKVLLMLFNATFNNISTISWQSALLAEETGENQRSVASHRQTLSHNSVSRTPPKTTERQH